MQAVPITEDSISNVNSEGTENNEKDVQGKNNEEVQNLSQTGTKDSKTSEEKNVENSGTEPEKESFDELLEYCFLKALKTIPKNCYPILPATFYAKYILANVPEGKIINLKKTKWKKFNVFLQEKSLEGLIKLQPMPKNEFTIAEANTDHQKVKRFVDPYKVITVEVESKNNKPIVQQIYSVSAVTLPFFSKFGLKKHDELTRNEVRDYVNDYIKTENLVDPNKPEFVILDPVLFQILKGEEVISRANLLIELLQKMSVQHKISNCGNGKTILHKGKMPLIEFETCLRTGNKKVTLISNLESYGVNVSNFSKELQHKAAASTTIIPTVPGKKGPQIQVQGNQVAVAFAILKEKHNLSEKSMKGLEKAVKPKNKK